MDEIDRALANYVEFTGRRTYLLINYDIAYHMGGEIEGNDE
jgi:hypothetical protein